jgi:hypothetical protein
LAPSDDNRALVNELLKALKHQQSLTKNGEPWADYFAKLITPGRIMWTFLAIGNAIQLIWLLGVQYRDVQVRLDASDSTVGIVKGLEENTRKQGELQSTLADTVAALMAENAALASQNDALATTARGLNDRLAVLRGDFNRTVQLQIIPRLEKIEKSQASAAEFSGEK